MIRRLRPLLDFISDCRDGEPFMQRLLAAVAITALVMLSITFLRMSGGYVFAAPQVQSPSSYPPVTSTGAPAEAAIPTPSVLDVHEVCLGWNVFFEARGEPRHGQIAVAEVTLRRAELSGRNVCAEVFEDRQFSWTLEPSPRVTNPRAWRAALNAAKTALLGQSNASRGATHYFNPREANPRWRLALCHAVTIGNHVFYRPCETGATT